MAFISFTHHQDALAGVSQSGRPAVQCDAVVQAS